MHETLLENVKAHIDFLGKKDGEWRLSGWAFVQNDNSNLVTSGIGGYNPQINLIVKEGEKDKNFIAFETERPDVKNTYSELNPPLACGFDIPFVKGGEASEGSLQIYIDDERKTFLNIDFENLGKTNLYRGDQPEISVNNPHPSLVVVDDFYSDPDAVREFALQQEFNPHIQNHKGQRTELSFVFPGTKSFLEDTLKKKITKWDYGTNGVFQFCTAEDQLVYHVDGQKYAAVVYLTPDAPASCGSSFWKSKHNGLMGYPTESDCERLGKDTEELFWEMFNGNFYDETRWELVDVIGNVYNRMAIWDAQLVHSATKYFGDKKENSRLFHMFFFDAE
tara:strand:+ start:2683 stop:3687 length:1005 start_codon:yes stop_codon:yes gene_type:complete